MAAKKNHHYRLGIDCRLAGKQHAGIGRYSENLVKELIKLSQEEQTAQITWVLFFFDANQAKSVLGANIYAKPKKYSVEIRLIPVKHYTLSEQIKLPKIFRRARLDLLHVPHFNAPIFYRQKLVLTIHDLLWHEQRGKAATTLNPLKYFFKYRLYHCNVNWAVKNASQIYVPTQTVEKTIKRYYPQASEKILVTKEGIAEKYAKNIKARQKNNNVKKAVKKQLVYTGSLYPHKNLILVIKSLHKLTKYQLLIVGSRNVFQERVKKLVARYKVKKQVKFLGYVEDEQLIKLYQESMALVQPSLSEGFGLTGIEAMASQTPVLASDIPVFREIYQDSAIYFDPHDCQSFVAAVEKLELAKRSQIIERGLKIAQQYSWRKMAQENLKHYLQLCQQTK